jgi:peptidoglycan L-alanyl-D-glutamate endopeptidase CwlK
MSTVCKDISELTSVAQTACNAFMRECEKRGLAVRITETYRSQERQNELYAQGRTTSGTVVTWTKNSRHTSRRAWDICQNVKGKEYDTSEGFFKKCGAVAADLGITWGGTWSTPDTPHFEVTTSWTLPSGYNEEEIDMEELNALKQTVEELKAQIQTLSAQLPTVYHYTTDVPEWGRTTVQKLLDNGLYSGAAADDLNLSADMLRMLVINDRKGLYD